MVGVVLFMTKKEREGISEWAAGLGLTLFAPWGSHKERTELR